MTQPGTDPSQPAQPVEYQSSVPAQPVGTTDKDARTWGMFCHLAALAGYIIPFGNVIGPLVVWQMKKDLSPFVNDQGKEAVNFHITVILYMLISLVLILVVIGIFLM